jgi:hypothetical protein
MVEARHSRRNMADEFFADQGPSRNNQGGQRHVWRTSSARILDRLERHTAATPVIGDASSALIAT